VIKQHKLTTMFGWFILCVLMGQFYIVATSPAYARGGHGVHQHAAHKHKQHYTPY
jgi:hypothetical protein